MRTAATHCAETLKKGAKHDTGDNALREILKKGAKREDGDNARPSATKRDAKHEDGEVRPRTAVLTRGFDPSLSLGSARPAVFRSSTYVFPSPEAAERAFDITAGRVEPAARERADLIYSRFSHPNAEIFEDQIVPLEAGAAEAAVFNSGMAAIMTAFFTFARPHTSIIYTAPLYGGTTGLIHNFMEPFGVTGIAVQAGQTAALDQAITSAADPCIVFLETPANPTMVMTDIERAVRNRPPPSEASGHHGGQHVSRPDFPASSDAGRRPGALLGHQVSLRLQRHDCRRRDRQGSGVDQEDPQPPRHVRQHPAARRVLDARQPPVHGRAAHESAEQKCAAAGGSAARPS